MKTDEYYWWRGKRYKYARPMIQDESSIEQWKKLAEYAELKLEEAYKVGYLAAMRDNKS